MSALYSTVLLICRKSDTRFLSSGFFMNQFPPGSLSIALGGIFSNFYRNWRYFQLCVYRRYCWHRWLSRVLNCMDSINLSPHWKKRKENFLIFKEIQRDRVQSHIWLTASSYMGKNLRISSYIRKPFLIYDFAPDPIWMSWYMRKV